MTLERVQAKRLVDRVLNEASLGDVRVRIAAKNVGHGRFGDSMPTTAGDIESFDLWVTAVTPDGRRATVAGNRSDPDSVGALVRQAETLARLSPIDPEAGPPLGSVDPLKVSALDRRVIRMSAAERDAVVGACLDEAGDLKTSGYLEHSDGAQVHGDRRGLFTHHRSSQVSLSVTCRTQDGTGSSRRGFVSHRLDGLSGASMTQEAAAWANRSKDPTAIDPGRYTVVLTPDASADLLEFFLAELSHRNAVEGRSFFGKPGGGTREGEELFARNVHLFSDPAHPDHPASPVASDGRPHRRVDWIQDGALRSMTASHAWAERSGVASLPKPSSLHMAGGSGDLDALVAGVDRGILVTRFWYNRMLARERIVATGLTRDGTFLIERGAIVRPVRNLRYNDSPLTLLQRVVAMATPQRAGLFAGRVHVLPPMVVEGFNFESASDAI